MSWRTVVGTLVAAACQGSPPAVTPAPTQPGPRLQPGTAMGIYSPEQHPLYDGHFVLSGARIYQVGKLQDESPWDHMGDDGTTAHLVPGSIEVDVDERANTGTFRAELDLPEGKYVVEIQRFEQFSPCQDGGIAAWLFEHGNSGCGDALWPKGVLYVAGWGWGSATLNGRPLRTNAQIHFMVTQGIRSRESRAVAKGATGAGAGAVNPALVQLDFYVRSPEKNAANVPDRQVFDHFFAMEVVWR